MTCLFTLRIIYLLRLRAHFEFQIYEYYAICIKYTYLTLSLSYDHLLRLNNELLLYKELTK